MRNLLIASTSTVHGQSYLEYLSNDIKLHFEEASQIVFIPYARPGGISWDDYTGIARDAFEKLGFEIVGVHENNDPAETLKRAQGIFTGGGNTFVLLKTLYDSGLVALLKERIDHGVPYMGSSAGSNIVGASIQTTNDMPIVYPPTFDALAAVPFNINPHFQDPDPDSKHMGETRETRIKEFLKFNDRTVVGLREGSHLIVRGDEIELKGDLSARIFSREEIQEYRPGSDLRFLIN